MRKMRSFCFMVQTVGSVWLSVAIGHQDTPASWFSHPTANIYWYLCHQLMQPTRPPTFPVLSWLLVPSNSLDFVGLPSFSRNTFPTFFPVYTWVGGKTKLHHPQSFARSYPHRWLNACTLPWTMDHSDKTTSRVFIDFYSHCPLFLKWSSSNSLHITWRNCLLFIIWYKLGQFHPVFGSRYGRPLILGDVEFLPLLHFHHYVDCLMVLSFTLLDSLTWRPVWYWHISISYRIHIDPHLISASPFIV